MHSNRHAKRGSSKQKIWRKRVGVEPTILAAKDRINGFEGHEGHRTPFASDAKIEPLLAATSGSPFATSLRARRTPFASDVKIEAPLAATPGSPFATSLRARRTSLASDAKTGRASPRRRAYIRILLQRREIIPKGGACAKGVPRISGFEFRVSTFESRISGFGRRGVAPFAGEFQQLCVGADFVVRASALRADFRAGQ